MTTNHVAGAAVSVVKDGKLFFARGYGYADVASNLLFLSCSSPSLHEAFARWLRQSRGRTAAAEPRIAGMGDEGISNQTGDQ